MEDKKQKSMRKLLERFGDVKILESGVAEFKVYALERDKNHGFSSPSLRVSHPSPFNTGDEYFIAEVKFQMSPRGGFIFYKHAFQLDMASVKDELKMISKEKARDITSSPQGIASILDEFYYEVAEFLVDYNGEKDNYPGIAKILYEKSRTASGKKFGV
jgi:hypothetical protein